MFNEILVIITTTYKVYLISLGLGEVHPAKDCSCSGRIDEATEITVIFFQPTRLSIENGYKMGSID